MSVNKENTRKWVEALRSGEYQQGEGALANEELDGSVAYCCLGVACDISGLGRWEDGDDGRTLKAYVTTREYPDGPAEYREEAFLPKIVADWLGIDENPDVHRPYDEDEDQEDGYEVSLTALNDSYRLSFNQIADLIEREYLTEVSA